MRHRVATSDKAMAISRDLHLDQSMDEALLFAHNQNDVSVGRVVLTQRSDSQQITGPQGRKHAHASRPQANLAAAAKSFEHEIEFYVLSMFGYQWCRDFHIRNCADEICTGNL
jgi:hypothetical protein